MMKKIVVLAFLLINSTLNYAQSIKPLAQYPSPMLEDVRPHHRLPEIKYPGYNFQVDSLLPKPVNIYVPQKVSRGRNADLLIHFFGSKNIVAYSAEHYHGRLIAVTVNLGSGSSAYSRPFTDTLLFNKLIDSIASVVKRNLHHSISIRKVIVSGFSAGYGAVREILGNKANLKEIDGVLLLDGLHASYIPDRKTLADGGQVNSGDYIDFLDFCKLATMNNSSKKFLFTHSEIFPGTFVSTTESADYLLKVFEIKAFPVLRLSPTGMQQISRAKKNHFEIIGFAGNSGPDHIDHLQGLPYFLNQLRKL